nr:NADH dehydrogenase subunit 6 [Grammoptera ruficornis]
MKSLLIMMSLTFIFLNHPLAFGSILLIQTILISLITGKLTYNFWFSYILFLIMIGGMLILFIYMTSIASNEKFKMSYKLIMFNCLLLPLIMLCLIFMDYYFDNFNINTLELINQNMYPSYKLSMNKFMNWPNNLIIYMMILYLLMTLIAVVKITKIQSGPLRQKN